MYIPSSLVCVLQLKFGSKSKGKRESKVKSGYDLAGADDADLEKQIRQMSDKEVMFMLLLLLLL